MSQTNGTLENGQLGSSEYGYGNSDRRPRAKPLYANANAAPLGLSAFALTTFVLSLVNVHARHITEAAIVIGPAFGYGGLVQLLAGMWEMAMGNTFGATALSSFGGFWLSLAIALTPGGFEIAATYTAQDQSFDYAFGFFLWGWFIITFLFCIVTLRGTVAFFAIFALLDLTFLLLACGYITGGGAATNTNLIKAGGWFGLATAFVAWYNALAGMLDKQNSFFPLPLGTFPWSITEKTASVKTERELV